MDLPEPTPAARQRLLSGSEGWTVFFVVLAVRLLVGGGAAMLFEVQGPAEGGAADPARNPFLNDPLWLVMGTLVSECATFAVLVGAYYVLRPSLEHVLPLRVPSLGGVVGALLVTFGLMPLAELGSELGARLDPQAPNSSAAVLATVRQCAPDELLLLVLGLAVVPALVEEAAFRGAITAAFRGSAARALIVPSLMFGVFHVDPSQLFATTVLGLGFGLARLATGSLLTSVFAHAVYNAAVLLIMHSGAAQPQGTPGVVRIVLGLAVTAAGVVILHKTPRPAQRDE